MTMRPTQHASDDSYAGAGDEMELTGSAGATDATGDEGEEMQAAAQLLEITNEAELDHFIGSLLQRSARTAGSALPLPVLQPLARSLRGALKRILPIVGDSSRAVLLKRVSSDAARSGAAAASFGLELEGLSPEDQEFELARRFVRLTRSAGLRAPRFARRMPPRIAVRRTLVAAARRHAPGLLRRRRRRRASLILTPVVYTEPEPVLAPAPADADAGLDSDPSHAPAPDTDSKADPDPNADADPNANADPEPVTESAPACHCGGTCARCRPRTTGQWVRQGAEIILQDI